MDLNSCRAHSVHGFLCNASTPERRLPAVEKVPAARPTPLSPSAREQQRDHRAGPVSEPVERLDQTDNNAEPLPDRRR
jgi:hypothetical protein